MNVPSSPRVEGLLFLLIGQVKASWWSPELSLKRVELIKALLGLH